jgi:Flp pilus assembly protein TadG
MTTPIKSAGPMLLTRASQLVRRLSRDQRGNIGIITALSLAALMGFGGLGTDVSLWMRAKNNAQSAADAAAMSAAIAGHAGNPNARITADVLGVAAREGLTNGTNGVVVTLHHPPTSGAYAGNSYAYEVVITAPQQLYLASVFASTGLTAPTVTGRAVALINTKPLCILSLDTSATPAKTPILASGSAVLTASNCDIDADSPSSTSIQTTGGGSITGQDVNTPGNVSGNVHASPGTVNTAASAVADPYANTRSIPTSWTNGTQAWTGTIHNPGVLRWNGDVTVSGPTTLDPGIYMINGKLTSSQPISGTGVTIILTGTSGVFTMNAGATLNVSAPTTGTTAGIAFWDATTSTNFDAFNGGSHNTITGAVYSPGHLVKYTGSSASGTGCTQLIAKDVEISGSATFHHDCSAGILDPMGSTFSLVE